MKIAKSAKVIVCDDIRQEVGGKHSLMGVYTGIVVNSLPSTLFKLSFAIMLEEVKVPINDAKVTITFPKDESKVVDLGKPPTVPKGKDLTINLFVAPVKILAEGVAELRIVFNNDDKLEITHKFNINKGVVNP